MTEHFCTYFDHRYLPKGLTMWRSLKSHRPSSVLHVLCLSEACHAILASLRLPDVHLYPLANLEKADPALLQARANRSLIEYYFTLTPCLPLHILETHPSVLRITYLDADLFFMSDPQSILDEMDGASIAVIEHRFPAELAHLEQYGRFNVGWLTFRNDATGLACLRVWRDQCLEWCFDRLEDGRFAEQKYLDQWPSRFEHVTIVQHRGANVAPWNLNTFELSMTGNQVSVGGQPLIFFHAHGFKPRSPGGPPEWNLETYRVTPTPLLSTNIFAPYEDEIVKVTTELAAPLALALSTDYQSRDASARLEELRGRLALLARQLATSEEDRTARLDTIQSLDMQLKASETDRAARLGVIQSLDAQLKASETDRAERLRVIQALQAQLAQAEAAEANRPAQLASLEAQLAGSLTDLARARGELELTRTQVVDLKNSRSWRWTAWLRRLGGSSSGL